MEITTDKTVTNREIVVHELATILEEEKALYHQKSNVHNLDPYNIAQCKLFEVQLEEQNSIIDRIAARIQTYHFCKDTRSIW